jgi:hypothetical protein
VNPTDAELATYWESQARHYRELSLRLHEQLLAVKHQPEKHSDRGLHFDPVGNKASARVDRQRDKKRNRTNGL